MFGFNKKDQNWVRKSGDYLVFPGGGIQFKDGVISYVEFIERVYHFAALSLKAYELCQLNWSLFFSSPS